MTVTALGDLSIGGALPGGIAVAAAGATGINLAVPFLQSMIAGLAAFAPQPVTLAGMLALAEQTLQGVQLAITAGITPPDISAQIAIVQAQLAVLQAALGAVDQQVGIIVDFQGVLATSGVEAYAFAGARNAFGGELATALGGATTASNAIVLLTSNGATWAAMSEIFKVTP